MCMCANGLRQMRPKLYVFTFTMVAVSPGFPVLVSKGLLGFPWVSRGFLGPPGFPEAVRNQHVCENIARDFGGSGFPAGELTLFKIKKRGQMYQGERGVLQTIPTDAFCGA